jgi:hypothetical protein
MTTTDLTAARRCTTCDGTGYVRTCLCNLPTCDQCETGEESACTDCIDGWRYGPAVTPDAVTSDADATTPADALSPIVKALETAWRMIRRRYPDAPNVVIVVQRDRKAWGHTTVHQVWHSRAAAQAKSGMADLYEVMISGENLDRGAVAVAATLIHEAAHARNLAQGIKDTDVNGRHNLRFKDTAEAMGLTVGKYEGRGAYLGWTDTSLDDDGQARWASMIKTIERGLAKAARARHAAMVTSGDDQGAGAGGMGGWPLGGAGLPPATKRGGRRNLIKAECQCGYSVRLSQTVLDLAKPQCQACGQPFDPVA